MGLFGNRRSSKLLNAGHGQNDAAVAGNSGSQSQAPPSYDDAKPAVPSVSKVPFRLEDRPFAEELVFSCPSHPDEALDVSKSGGVFKGKGKGTAPSDADRRSITVSLSIPKVAYNAGSQAAGKQPTVDIYFHLEYPGDELMEVIIEATYTSYSAPLAEKAETEAVKEPWFVSSSLAAALINRDFDLESKGRFTNKATMTLRPGSDLVAKDKENARMYKTVRYRCLDSRSQAICATSAYFGPCLVSVRVGIMMDRYSNGRYIPNDDEITGMAWKELKRPILIDGKSTDFISPYIYSVNSVKLLQ